MFGPNHASAERCEARDSQGRCQCVGFCELTGGDCKFSMPELDAMSALALRLFLECNSARQWEYAGMSGVRSGIPYERVKLKADAIGVDFNDELLQRKFDSCVDVVVTYDAERASAKP